MTPPNLFPDTPTISVVGTTNFDSPTQHNEVVLSAALATARFRQDDIQLAAGELNRIVTSPLANANFLALNTNRKIRYRVNGGTEDFFISRLILLVGCDISSLEFFNDQASASASESVDVAISWGLNDGEIT